MKIRVEFTTESFEKTYKEYEHFFALHGLEAEPGDTVNVDIESYIDLDRSGQLRTYVVRSDGKCIGYAFFFFCVNMHQAGSVNAVQSAIYIDKEYRCGRMGIDFCKFIESDLKRIGVNAIIQSSRDNKKDLTSLFKFLGYNKLETLWIKKLA